MRDGLFVTLGLLVLLAVAGRAPAMVYGGHFDSEGEREALRAAERAFDHREYDKAWDAIVRAMDEYPESLDAIRAFIQLANMTNRLDEIHRYFRADSADPLERLRVHFGRGWLAVLLGDYRMAREELEAAAELSDPPDFELRRARLVLDRFEGTRNSGDLLASYRQLVADYPDVGLAHLSYLNTFNFTGAGTREHRDAMERALAAEEVLPQTYIRAMELAERDFWFDHQRGLEIIDEGLDRHPENSELGIRRVLQLRRLGRLNEALAWSRTWERRAPNHGDFALATMELLVDLQRYDEALEAADRLKELTGQPSIRQQADYRRAEILHMMNRRDAAAALLADYVRQNPNTPWYGAARQLLYMLQTAPADARVHLVPDVGFLQQRGNYCGPATISTILRRWGRNKTQEEIADRVYTGIAGTPPQVLHHFARSIGFETVEFEGDVATWKRLLDGGYPILWLQMMGTDGGHYRIISGYDDVRQAWIVHDPNRYTREYFGYENVDDTWVLPSLRRSIVFVPEDRMDDPALAGLEPTTILVVSNWALYIATGANLFVGLFPALPVNLGVALVLGLGCAWLLRRVTLPRRLPVVGMTLGLVAPVAVLNLVIGLGRVNEAVSALLGFHLALLTLLPLLAGVDVLRRFVGDFLAPRESLGLAGLVLFVWLSLAFIDQRPWETLVPVAVFALGFPILLWPRWGLYKADRALALGDTGLARRRLLKVGSGGEGYYAGRILEVEAALTAGDWEAARLGADDLLKEPELPRVYRQAVWLNGMLAGVLAGPEPEQARALAQFRREERLTGPGGRVARALHLAVSAEAGEGLAVEDVYTPDPGEEEALLEQLHRDGARSFPGMPVVRGRLLRPVQRAAFFLAYGAALRRAREAGDDGRHLALWTRWGGVHELARRMLEGLEPPGPSRVDATELPAVAAPSPEALFAPQQP